MGLCAVTALLFVLFLGALSVSCVLDSVDFEYPSQYVRSHNAHLRVLVQGSAPSIVIVPSYGRDGGSDFDKITDSLVKAGYSVLRPQPRGMRGSTGPMQNVTLDDLAADVAIVIDKLATGGKAIVLGHAFDTFVPKNAAASYPNKIPAIVTAAPRASHVPDNIAPQPFITGNNSLPRATRLAALKLAFFAPNHDASIWLDGWNTATLSMERGAIEGFGDLTRIWGGAETTEIWELIPADDPSQPKATWKYTTRRFPGRVVPKVVKDASHALFPEQPVAVERIVLPWLVGQVPKLGRQR